MDYLDEFENRGMFRNRWNDFHLKLRDNIRDGRCYMGEYNEKKNVDETWWISRVQTSEYISEWTFNESNTNAYSTLTIRFDWNVGKDLTQEQYLNNQLYQLAQMTGQPVGINETGGLTTIRHRPYTGIGITLWRIDEFDTTAPGTFNWNTSKKTELYFTQRSYPGVDDEVSDGGGTRQQWIYFRSDMKFSEDDVTYYNGIWLGNYENEPEYLNNRLQTDRYYFLVIKSNLHIYNDDNGTQVQTLQYNSVASPVPKPLTTNSILNAKSQGKNNFWSFSNAPSTNNYFPWFATPPTFDPKRESTPSLRWGLKEDFKLQGTTTNPMFDGTVTAVADPANPSVFDVTLRAHMFYDTIDLDAQGDLKIPGDSALQVGFAVRNMSIPGSQFSEIGTVQVSDLPYTEYIRSLPTLQGGTDNSRAINFEHTFKVPAQTNWEYRIFVRKNTGKYYYSAYPESAVDPYKAISTPYNFEIKVPGVGVTGWWEPAAQNRGFWYQMYYCWSFITGVLSNMTVDPKYKDRLTPFHTVLPAANPTQLLGSTVKLKNVNYPIHYYMNYDFVDEKTYQFRTIVEEFYDFGNNSTSATNANLTIILPWGEYSKIPTPYIALDTVPKELKRLNLYTYGAINSYSYDNNPGISKNRESTPIKPQRLFSSRNNPKNPITFTATSNFGSDVTIPGTPALLSGLAHVSVTDFDWFVQGTALWSVMTQVTSGNVVTKDTEKVPYFIQDVPYGGRGWHYISRDRKFIWFDKIGVGGQQLPMTMKELNSGFPFGGDPSDYFANKRSAIDFLFNNFIATFIPYQSFNISFDYTNNSPFKITMYLGGDLPTSISQNVNTQNADYGKTDIEELISKGLVTRIGTLERSTSAIQKCEFIGLVGNQFIFFVADPVIDINKAYKKNQIHQSNFDDGLYFSNTPQGMPLNDGIGDNAWGTYSVIELYNFKLSGAYNKNNNNVFTVGNNFKNDFETASYTIKLGVGNNVFPNSANSTITVNSQAGNGGFLAGVWQNGVWNNGWREDNTIREFIDISDTFFYNKARVWRMTIKGDTASSSFFKVGDVVSISNVAAIDLNDNRKLLNKYYKILSTDEDTITVELDVNFPIKRIEKDSENHRILVSKNIWLSGVFLNGYFGGIWNNGLFSGYPFITRMENSHWIDGIFNGGHFNAKKNKFTFFSAQSVNFEQTQRLGLSFLTPHSLKPGDTISITFSTASNLVKTFGTTTVLSVPNNLSAVTGIAFDKTYKGIKGGTVNTLVSSGLIQNFRFYSNNASKVTSLNTMISERVFNYNSWIDVNYSNKSAVNIGRPQTSIEPYSDRAYSENNLYGYPTNDVLSSESVFRDSFSNSSRRYRLGKKYTILNDFVGDSSKFEKDFGPTETDAGLLSFEEQGWSFVTTAPTKSKFYTMDQGKIGNPPAAYLYLDFVTNDVVRGLTAGDSISVSGPIFNYMSKPWLPNLGSFPFADGTYTYDVLVTDVIGTQSGVIRIETNSTLFSNYGEEGIQNWDVEKKYTSYSMYKENGSFWIETLSNPSIAFSRTPEPTTANTPLVGKELKVSVTDTGGILDLIPTEDVLGRTNGRIDETTSKLKYTMVEFDLVDFRNVSNYGIYESNTGNFPPLHFNNLNLVSRQFRSSTGLKELKTIGATYLPIYRNVNHLATPGRKKQEFFFNKRNLLMNFTGSGPYGTIANEFYLDNLKFYEVDMIPFFQYFRSPSGRSGNINISVQIPNTGTATGLNLSDDDSVVDATTDNDVVNDFVGRLVGLDVLVPMGVNWKSDYAVYRTQTTEGNLNSSLYRNGNL